MASNSATASFALLDCSGPIRCSAIPGEADINPGHFALASCTRFSPNTRCPAAMTGAIASASNVWEPAISVTEERSRRACSQARAMSCSTVDSPFGKCGVIDTGISGVMSSISGKFTGSFEFYQILERLLEPLSLACEPGDEDVTRYFQPQKGETQEASWNPRAAGVAGADPGGALDAGMQPLARGQPCQTGRASLPGILEARAA